MADISDVKSATSVPELKKIISTDKAPAAIGPYSQATVVGKTAYVSGCIAIIPGSSPPSLAEGGIEGQTRQLLDNMKAVVEACGGTMANVCKTTIFLHGDMSNCALRVSSNTQAGKCSVVALPSILCARCHIVPVPIMNKIYAEYFPTDPPARSTIAVAGLPLGALIEIECIAALE